MVAAIVLAAGMSTRMGGDVPKQLLPWGRHTVVQEVLDTLVRAGIPASTIWVVVGHARLAVEGAVAGYGVQTVFSPDYVTGEMLASLQAGLQALPPACAGALIALADQPQMQVAVVVEVLKAFAAGGRRQIVIPSYAMRRGHPVILPRWLWPEILTLAAGDTLRTVLDRHADANQYVLVDTPTILADVDTPAQYAAEMGQLPSHPGQGAEPAQE